MGPQEHDGEPRARGAHPDRTTVEYAPRETATLRTHHLVQRVEHRTRRRAHLNDVPIQGFAGRFAHRPPRIVLPARRMNGAATTRNLSASVRRGPSGRAGSELPI